MSTYRAMYITLETRKIDHNSRDGEATDSTTVATQDAQAMRAEALRQIELLPGPSQGGSLRFHRHLEVRRGNEQQPHPPQRIPLHDNLTEDQAKEKVFAFTDISKYVEEMNDNPARRSEFYYTKFFHLRAHLGGNHAVHKEWLSEAQKAYQRVLSAYAGDGKFFHLRAHLGGNNAVQKEWVSEAQKAYQRVFSAYASDGKVEIDKMGNELNKLRQDLDPNQ
ncbi:hypothetical protein EG328_004469 [Venturia inaequalis]|uniref:Uncharacterized protein n=1 Tax=Venturia inaequalis TaxID=5025 RepID=A0A8H3UPA3_VENIN|nr:hypothetical protein EG328_004469 [Venturia inaequalis]